MILLASPAQTGPLTNFGPRCSAAARLQGDFI